MATPGTFLTAEWRHLLMLNWPVEPGVLAERVPSGCELDTWNGDAYVSVVGFRFLRTRVLGIPIPFHRDFEEVNLRFYVRRRADDGWRRGVVFVKELVPHRAIAFVARHGYGENYHALPMRHAVAADPAAGPATASYEWRRGGAWERAAATFTGEPARPADGTAEAFIAEHYWGYSARADGSTTEYGVEHPPWRVWRASDAELACDVAALYGPEFVDALAGPPASAFVAEGSPVVVRRGRRLRADGPREVP